MPGFLKTFILLQFLYLAGCGGGGSSGAQTPSVDSNASLSALSIAGQSLEQAFQPARLNYSAHVGYYDDLITIVFATGSAAASVAVTDANGAPINPNTVSLAEGNNRFSIRVTANAGNTQTYSLEVGRESFAEFAKGYPESEYYQPEKLSAPEYEVRVEPDVRIPMRDGVTLSADIYFPVGAGPAPVLLRRSPYGKRNDLRVDEAHFFAQRGYVVVLQDTRGKFDSGGEYYPYRHEFNDGYDTDQWIGTQPWSNGKIGTFGGSYVGYTQWTQALSASQYLTAIAPEVTTADIFNQWTYVDGAFHYGFTLPWGAIFMKGRVPGFGGNYDAEHLPILTADAASGSENPSYRDWLEHPRANDVYWDGISFEDEIHNIKVPALVVEGWYDIFLRGALDDHVSIQNKSQSDAARTGKRIMIGPWTHLPRGRNNAPNASATGSNRSLDFGADAVVDMRKVYLRWYDHWLKGSDNGVAGEPPILIFLMGENRWRYEHEWPLARTQYTPYYFQSTAAANSLNGDGELTTTLPSGAPFDSFVYDPANPVPSAGGNVCCGPVPEGPWNQAGVEARDDVLVYDSAELTQAVEVTGPIKVKLYASSSATDTDWTAKLVDVHPDGYAQNIQDGILRARYRAGKDQPAALLNPGAIYEYEIDLWASSNVFLPGHRIRVEISSSNFPRFDRNLNTGDNPATGVGMQSAQQRVYHSAQYPSHILLPIIPR